QLLDMFRGTQSGLGAMLEVAAAAGWDVVPTISAGATPSANIPAQVHEALKGRLIERLRASGRLDGVLLYLHGAMLSDNAPDAEGDICRAVRQLLGPDVPIVLELDL